MRRWAFAAAMIGLFVLFVLVNLPAKRVENLEGLEAGQKVSLEGVVVEEKIIFGDEVLIELDNGIELVCTGCETGLEGEMIGVSGKVEEYEGARQVRVLRINYFSG